MRITNPMMANRMMLNINRNAQNVNTLYGKWSSSKEIQFPSDNPIVASRILKFRTTLAENLQYQKNASQGLSWMEVTEDAYDEVTKLTKAIRDLVAQGDGVETAEDKKNLATQIQSLTEQLGLAMNRSYTGRYLFSGFRTDEPGTILKDDATLAFTDIEQHFSRKDMENTVGLERDNANNSFNNVEISIVKLAYRDIANGSINVTMTMPDGSTFSPTVNYVSINSNSAYSPADGEVNYIAETGELVLSKKPLTAGGTDIPNTFASMDVTYDKTGFKAGELNPKTYFSCTDSAGKTYTMADKDQSIEYEFGEGTRFAVNALAKNTLTDKMYADLNAFCDAVLGVEISNLDDVMASILKADPSKTEEEARKEALNFIDNEKNKADVMLKSRFSNMLTTIDKHASTVSKTHTDLISRMDRLEMIQLRLEADEESFTKLLSDNEDADLIETAMLLSNAESTYQASMQIGMRIIQTSLVNFL